MASKVAAAALQYSKKLSQEITWFWMIYRLFIGILSAIRPEIAASMSSTIAGVDTIMMMNVGTYLVNSLGEKYIYSDRFVSKWIDKGGWRSLISRIGNDIASKEDDEESLG